MHLAALCSPNGERFRDVPCEIFRGEQFSSGELRHDVRPDQVCQLLSVVLLRDAREGRTGLQGLP